VRADESIGRDLASHTRRVNKDNVLIKETARLEATIVLDE